MCTISWLPRDDGFTLWHSRDEQRARAPGLPPRVERGHGIGWIAPADTEAGGTWIGVNTAGVATAIANLFVGTPPVAPAIKLSRGLLVRRLLGRSSTALVATSLSGMNLQPYEPFTLVSLETGRAPLILRWDRQALTSVEPLGRVLLVTSAGGHRPIEAARQELFRTLEKGGAISEDSIEQLYRAPPSPTGSSIGVDRPDVSTVSLTRIEVSADQVAMTYSPGVPSTTAAGAPVTLRRV
ncbi:MAG TPA: NRDE family protein [Gemmatimonadales bacterium]|nr:NRDE family protein [Gemmatimonadales bacterium]